MKNFKSYIAALSTLLIIGVFTSAKQINIIDKGKEVSLNPGWKNLKVLPQDISEEELKGVMRNFNTSLGVKCRFCHASNQEGKMDFASDANNKKEIARSMMNMTNNLNKEYFDVDVTKDQLQKVTCFTCHQGKQEPVNSLKPEVELK